MNNTHPQDFESIAEVLSWCVDQESRINSQIDALLDTQDVKRKKIKDLLSSCVNLRNEINIFMDDTAKQL